MQGFLVYSFRVIDSKNLSYSIIVDPTSNIILYQSQGHAIKFGYFGMMTGHGHMKGGFKHGGQGWSKHTLGNSATPSSGTQ